MMYLILIYYHYCVFAALFYEEGCDGWRGTARTIRRRTLQSNNSIFMHLSINKQ